MLRMDEQRLCCQPRFTWHPRDRPAASSFSLFSSLDWGRAQLCAWNLAMSLVPLALGENGRRGTLGCLVEAVTTCTRSATNTRECESNRLLRFCSFRCCSVKLGPRANLLASPAGLRVTDPLGGSILGRLPGGGGRFRTCPLVTPVWLNVNEVLLCVSCFRTFPADKMLYFGVKNGCSYSPPHTPVLLFFTRSW